MRRLLALVTLFFGLAVALPAATQSRDWRTNVVRSAAGAYQIGNPDAPVKLAEYLSYTCGHCAEFARDSKAVLFDQWVRDGKVRLEIRSAVRDPIDLSAAMLTRCAAPARFYAMSDAIFAGQPQIFARARALNGQNIGDNFKLIAERTGLTDIARAHGLTDPQINACFATNTDRDRLLAMANASFRRIQGTPSFEINGELKDAHGWSALEPLLRAAGVR